MLQVWTDTSAFSCWQAGACMGSPSNFMGGPASIVLGTSCLVPDVLAKPITEIAGENCPWLLLS